MTERRPNRWPWLTLLVVASGLVASLLPGAPERLVYDRGAVDGGAWWRLLSGQLVHGSARMALLDLGLLLVLGVWVESRSRRMLALTLGLAAVLVGLALHLGRPGVTRFHGASGLDAALFAFAALWLVRTGRRGVQRYAAALAVVALLLKTLAEVISGRTFFAGPSLTVEPLAHLVGALVGACLALLRPSLDPPG